MSNFNFRTALSIRGRRNQREVRDCGRAVCNLEVAARVVRRHSDELAEQDGRQINAIFAIDSLDRAARSYREIGG